MSRLSYVPLRRPASLVFSARSSFQYNYIFNYLGNFSAVKSFSIINGNPSSFPNVSLSSYLPQLQRFTLHVKVFPPSIQLASFLPNTLHELYLRNDGGGRLPNVSHFELPQLRVLGITSPGSYLLDRLTARGVRSLTFYGPHAYSGAQFTVSAKANALYGQLHHLKFEDWKTPSISNASFGAVSVFRNLSTKISALQTVTFVNSHVDGGDLVSIAATMVAPSGQSANLKKLEEIKLSYPIGITNDQCEELKKLVKRVKIYM
ncbi:hypothetical protein CPB86DRAFT_817818 [Serendipita vermifera]|nr:hypothetical protein CPB86DRAFT_817818 [Serendipita vermifera]